MAWWKWWDRRRDSAPRVEPAPTPPAADAPAVQRNTQAAEQPLAEFAAGARRRPMTRTRPAPPPQREGGLPATPASELFTQESLEQAWRAVRRAGGGAGVDGVTIEQFEDKLETELETLRKALVSGDYRPQPVRQVMVPKRKGGLRPLALWALRDRVAQRAVYELLAPVFEPTFLPCSYGFRPGRGVEDAIRALQGLRDQQLLWVMDGDIQDCFDAIPAPRLLGLMRRRVREPLVMRYVARWLSARIFNSADGVPHAAGASQGSALSPLLANIYLHEVDQQLLRQNLAYLRYADDFIICCQRRADAVAAAASAQQALAAWDLQLNPRKSRIVHFDEGFTWLGWFFVRRDAYPVER